MLDSFTSELKFVIGFGEESTGDILSSEESLTGGLYSIFLPKKFIPLSLLMPSFDSFFSLTVELKLIG